MHLDDMVEVRSQIVEVGNSSLKMQQDIWVGELEVCRMLMHIVCINEEKKPVKMPAQVLGPLRENMMKES
jgi:acyl-CoA thioesterase FadM